MKEREIFSGLDNLFGELTEEWFGENYSELSVVSNRWRVFTAPVISFLFIVQKLSTRNSLSSALAYLRESNVGSGIDKLLGGSRRVAVKDLSSSIGGISQARTRLSLEVVSGLFDTINLGLARLNRKAREDREAKRKRRWFLLDGSTIGLQNTAAIKQEFPALSNQNGKCLPCARVVFAHNLFDALAQHPAFGPMTESEQALAKKVLERLPEGSGVIGDRNFGVFSTVYHTHERGLLILARMNAARTGALIGKDSINQDGIYDIAWTPSKKDCRTNPDIPETAGVRGRIIVTTVNRQGFRSERFFFFTTDDSLTAQDVVDLYKERWLIENDIRTLKHTVNLDVVYAKTPDMVRKEIFFGIIAYNMIRALMIKGAAAVQLKPRDISFTRAVEIILTTAVNLSHASTPLEADIIIAQFYKSIRQVRHPKRTKLRFEPRALVSHRRPRFPALKGPRHEAKTQLLNQLDK